MVGKILSGEIMNTREKIIYALLEESSKKGIGKVSMNDVANKVGIKKASIYYYFESKDTLIKCMYDECRSKASSMLQIDFNKSAKEIIYESFLNYLSLCNDKRMKQVFFLIEAEKFINKEAGKLYINESVSMVKKTLELFKYLEESKKAIFNDINFAANSYAFYAHQMIIIMVIKDEIDNEKIKEFIDQFLEKFANQL